MAARGEDERVGCLSVVPTPIGNLEDITFRALRVLREADMVLAEDTRTTGILLKHYEIETKLYPFHLNNEHAVLDRFVQQLVDGARVALVSDAGTPGISDPGFLLIREAIRRGVEVTCLPGPTALIPALVGSGLPCDRFVFEGFLPVKKGRRTRIAAVAQSERTVVLYESPHRLVRLLHELQEEVGESRRVCVAREISKVYETYVRGTVGEVLEEYGEGVVRGECVVIVEGKSE